MAPGWALAREALETLVQFNLPRRLKNMFLASRLDFNDRYETNFRSVPMNMLNFHQNRFIVFLSCRDKKTHDDSSSLIYFPKHNKADVCQFEYGVVNH